MNNIVNQLSEMIGLRKSLKRVSLLVASAVFLTTSVYAVFDDTRVTVTGNYKVVMIGASSLMPATNVCPGTDDVNNDYKDSKAAYSTKAGGTTTTAAQSYSSAQVTENMVPAGCATVAKAYLYWGGSYEEEGSPWTAPVWITGPDGEEHAVTRSAYGTTPGSSTDDRQPYWAYADVSSLLEGSTTGTFGVRGVSCNFGSGAGPTAGWCLVLLYESPEYPATQFMLYDGASPAGTGGNNQSTMTKTVTFSAYTAGNIYGSVGIAAIDGDVGSKTDDVTFKTNNGTQQNLNELRGATDFFNSTMSYDGEFMTHTPNCLNTLGYDAHHIELPVGAVTNTDNSATITIKSNDTYVVPFMMYVAIRSEVPHLVVSKTPSSSILNLGQTFKYFVELENDGGKRTWANNTVMLDTLDYNIDLVANTVKYSLNGGAQQTATYTFNPTNRQLRVYNLPAIPAGQKLTISYQVNLKDATHGDLWRYECMRSVYNRAKVTYYDEDRQALQRTAFSGEVGCGDGDYTKIPITADFDSYIHSSITHNVTETNGSVTLENYLKSVLRTELGESYSVDGTGGVPTFTYYQQNKTTTVSGNLNINTGATQTYYAKRTIQTLPVKGGTCSEEIEIILNRKPCSLTNVTFEATQTNCAGNEDGTVSLLNISTAQDMNKGCVYTLVSGTVDDPTGVTPANTLATYETKTETSHTFTGLAVGNYSVMFTDGLGCKVIRSGAVTEPTPITVPITSTAACVGSRVRFTAAATGGTAGTGYTYKWYRSADGSTYEEDPTQTGNTYDVTSNLTNIYVKADAYSTIAECNNAECKGTGTGSVTLSLKPELTLADDEICEGGSVTLTPTDANSATIATRKWESSTDGTTWTVIAGQTGASLTQSPTVTTHYRATFTAVGGCEDVVTATVTVTQKPTVTVSGSTSICPGESADLTLTFTGTPPFNYTLNGEAGTSNDLTKTVTVTPATTTIYAISALTDDNCAGTDFGESATVSIYTRPTATVSGTTSICPGGSTDLTLTFTGTPPFNYTLNGEAGTSNDLTKTVSVTPAATTTYTISAVSDANCAGTDFGESATITVNSLPTATVSGTTAICAGDPAGANLTLTFTGKAPFSYSLSDGTTTTNGTSEGTTKTINVTPSATTTYSITAVSDDNGCAGTELGESATITVNPLPTIETQNLQVCVGATTANLNDAITNTTAGVNYSFYTDAEATVAVATPTAVGKGTYYIKAVTPAGCSSVSGPVSVTEYTKPIVTIDGTDETCPGTNVELTASSLTFASYTWTNATETTAGKASLTASATCGGTTEVTLVVTDANGCPSEPATFTLTAKDETAPTLALSATEVAALNSAACVFNVPDLSSLATKSDNCSAEGDIQFHQSLAENTAITETTTVEVWLTDKCNNPSAHQNVTITVPVVPEPTVSVEPAVICQSSPAEVTVNAVSDPWTGTIAVDGTTLTGTTIAANSLTAGEHTITYTISGYGCSKSASATLNVNATVTANAGSVTPVSCVCSDDKSVVTMAATAPTVGTGTWTCSDASVSIADINSPTTTVSNLPVGTTTLTWTVTNGTGAAQCQATSDVEVNITADVTAPTFSLTTTTLALTEGTNCEYDVPDLSSYVTSITDACSGSTIDGTNIIYSQTPTAGTKISAAREVSITLTDKCGNTSPAQTFQLTVPTPLSAIASVVDAVKCHNGADGKVTVAPTGGSGDYSFAWNDASAQTTQVASALEANNYTVTVTDNKTGCTTTASVQLENPLLFTAEAAQTKEISCNGLSDGQAEVTSVSGGTGAASSYLWDNGQETAAASDLSFGDHTVTVKDGNGCPTTVTVTITQPEKLTVEITGQTNNICKNGTMGTATALAQGGTVGSGYRYQWNDPASQETATATGLTAGKYSVVAIDQNNCQTDPVSVTITEATEIAGGATPVETSTPTATDGQIINISATGGYSEATGYEYAYRVQGSTTPLTYQSGNSFTGLAAGHYDVYARNVLAGKDFSACEYLIATVEIEKPSDIKGVITNTDVKCYGETTGTVTAKVTEGGNEPYRLRIESTDGTTVYEDYSATYAVNEAHTFATKLAAGNYRIRVKDAHDYEATIGTFKISQPSAALNAEISAKTDVQCYNGSDGTATVTVTGGTEGTGYTYSWNDPSAQTTAVATALKKGTYTVTVTDANECTATAIAEIGQPNELTVSITASTNVRCKNGNNGSLTATAAEGTGPYTYTWTNTADNSTVGGNNATVTNLPAGIYKVTVKDAHNCSAEDQKEITQPDALNLTPSFTTSLCYGQPKGSASVAVTGGTPDYHYAWTDALGAAVGGDEATVSNVAKGTYHVTVTDANECQETATIEVDEAPEMQLTMSQTTTRCFGTATGTATVTVTGGTEGTGYQYLWNDASAQTTATATNLATGEYTVTVTDGNSCVKSNTIMVQDATKVVPEIVSKENAKCKDERNGTATLTATGGTAPYTYDWGGGITGETNAALSAGDHTVTVKDNNECEATILVSIGEPEKLTVDVTVTNAYCSEVNDGTVTAVANGGTPDYTYTWSNGMMGASLTGLSGGTISVTVEDGNGCQAEKEVTVIQATPITGGATPTSVSIPGGNDGKVTVDGVSGGYDGATYEYAVRKAGETSELTYQSTTVFSSLTEGYYEVWARNVGDKYTSCAFKLTQVKVNAPSDITATITSDAVKCYGDPTGTIHVVISDGGTAPYQLRLMNSDETETLVDYGASVEKNVEFLFENQQAGNYAISVKDANNYEASLGTIAIKQPSAALKAEITSKADVKCNEGTDGTATVTVTGGTKKSDGSYSYAWNTPEPQEVATASNLKKGTYTVTVTDANECTATATVEIGQPEKLVAEISSQKNVICNGGATGTATVTVTGGTGERHYTWSNGQTAETATGLAAGNYTVTVKDDNECVAEASVTITEATVITATATPSSVTQPGGSDGSISLSNVSGGFTGAGYEYELRQGTTVLTPYQSSAVFSGLSEGEYTVYVRNTMSGETFTCEYPFDATVGAPGSIVGTVSSTSPTCYGEKGTVTAVVTTGGTEPYLFRLETETEVPVGDYSTVSKTAGEEFVFDNVEAGSYKVRVKDNSGYTSLLSGTATVTVPSQIGVNPTPASVSQPGGHDGSISVTATGGLSGASYLYELRQGATVITAYQSSNVFNGLSEGDYTIYVKNAQDGTEFNCEYSAPATVGAPGDVIGSLSSTSPTCYGEKGTVTASVTSGGTAPFQFQLEDASGAVITAYDPSNTKNYGESFTFSAVPDGTYKVRVKDATEYPALLNATATVTVPSQITLSVGSDNVSQPGGSDGTITVNETNGGFDGAGYLYELRQGTTIVKPYQSATQFTGLASGDYTVYVKNTKDGETFSCEYSSDTRVGEPGEIAGSLTAGKAKCFGTETGTVTVTVNEGGTAPYTVRLMKADGTTEYKPYSTSITQGQSYTFDNVQAGTYRVSVKDATGYEKLLSNEVTVDEASAITASASTNPISTPIATDGQITVENVAGGYGEGATYLYKLTKDGVTIRDYQTSPSFTNLEKGDYVIYLKNSLDGVVFDCEYTITAHIGAPGEITGSVTGTQPLCYNDKVTVSATVTSGGTAPYTFQLETTEGDIVIAYGATRNANETFEFTNISEGSYRVRAKDNAGYDVLLSGTHTVNMPKQLTANVTTTDAKCFNGNDGSATVNFEGGTGSMSYVWNTGSENRTLSNIIAGDYSVTVTDGNGCKATASGTVGQPQAPLALNTSVQDVKCYGESTGSASVSVTGGTGSYSYSWNTGASDAQISDMAAGTYRVTVTDENRCSETATATINQPDAGLNLTTSTTAVNCKNGEDGSATVNVTGGTGTYSYQWNDSRSQAASTATNLTAGEYTVTVTDANRCSATATAMVTEPSEELSVAIEAGTIACEGGSTTLTANAAGGTKGYGYSYSWNNGTSDATTTVKAGTFTVTVTDANNCTASATTKVDDGFVATASLDAPTVCLGQPMTFTLQTNMAAPNVNWNVNGNAVTNNDLTFTLTPDASGSITANVTVSDASGCQATASSNGTVNSLPSASVTSSTVCAGTTMTFTASTNAANPSIEWTVDGVIDDSQTGSTYSLNDVTAGNHGVSIIVTDGLTGCQSAAASTSATAQESPAAPEVENFDVCVSKGKKSWLSLVKSYPEGTTLHWYTDENLNGAVSAPTSIDYSEVGTKTYYVAVTSPIGCKSKPASITASVHELPSIASIKEEYDKSATVTMKRGTAPYTYNYGNSVVNTTEENSFNIGVISIGKHGLTVTDVYGCKVDTILSMDPTPLEPDKFFSPNGDGVNDTWQIHGLERYPATLIYIYDRYGKELVKVKGQDFTGWDGTYNNDLMPGTDYWYIVEVKETGKRFVGHFLLKR